MPNNKGGKKYKRNKNIAQENKNTRFKDENELTICSDYKSIR